MTLKNWIIKQLGVQAIQTLPEAVQRVNRTELRQVGNEITLYPLDGGERYITKGYQLNDACYSIVSKNAEKAGQIRFTHNRIKRTERKTREEYDQLTKGTITQEVLKEARRMRKAMTEDLVADSPLARFLNKPNRNQTQSEFIEQLFGLRELQGEGNIWFPPTDGVPLEMFAIPKPHLSLIGDMRDPWNIIAYKFTINGHQYRWEKDEVVMWKYSNPTQLTTTLDHLRGLAPLTSFMISLQGMNEGDFALAASNKNRGAYGFAYREDLTQAPTKDQVEFMRSQFDQILYDSDMIGKVGLMGGKWGYHNLGATVEAQQFMEQYSVGFKRLCRVFKTPAEIFGEGNDTYENQRQYKRTWIFDKIAPNLYNLRSLLNDKLLKSFGLDQDSHIIDCDVMSLQEMSQDLKDQVAALKDAWWLTPNQKLDATGYEKMSDPNMDKIYIPSGYSTLDQLNLDMGGSLNSDVNALNL
jgi:phage portal protein BeeE